MQSGCRLSWQRFLTVTILMLLACLPSSAGLATAQPAPTTTQPNIILILADDLDQNLDTLSAMPQLQTLLTERGTRFSRFFTTISLCCPSRASLLRGQYTHNHQVYTNNAPDGGFDRFHAADESSTVATWLKDAGYRTVLLGKYLNGYPGDEGGTYIPPGWTEWYSPADGYGYAEYNYVLNENGALVNYGALPQDYLTDVLGSKATGVIQRTASDSSPLFLYIAPFSPHYPATPAPRHANMFPNAQVPRTLAFNEADVSDKPLPIRALPSLTENQIQVIDNYYRRRLQAMQSIDEMIGDLIQALQAAGKLDNTYLFFTSDNGYHMGQHRLTPGKYLAYEEDIHLPLIVRGPGVPAQTTLDHIVSNIDLAPTFAQLAGIQPPAFVDGRSLVPLFGANPPPVAAWRQAFLVEQYPFSPADGSGGQEPPDGGENPTDTPLVYTALRTPRFKYVEYATGEREVYDLQNDPHELQNLDRIAPPDLLAELSIWLAQLHSCSGEACRTFETALPQLNHLYLSLLARNH